MPLPLPLCQVCGRPLSLRGYLRNLRRGETTYPFRMQDDSRREETIRWLCGACEQRAERHRGRLAESRTTVSD